jgi:hypothetical protein
VAFEVADRYSTPAFAGADHHRVDDVHRGAFVAEAADHPGAATFFDEGQEGSLPGPRSARPAGVAAGRTGPGYSRACFTVNVLLDKRDLRFDNPDSPWPGGLFSSSAHGHHESAGLQFSAKLWTSLTKRKGAVPMRSGGRPRSRGAAAILLMCMVLLVSTCSDASAGASTTGGKDKLAGTVSGVAVHPLFGQLPFTDTTDGQSDGVATKGGGAIHVRRQWARVRDSRPQVPVRMLDGGRQPFDPSLRDNRIVE